MNFKRASPAPSWHGQECPLPQGDLGRIPHSAAAPCLQAPGSSTDGCQGGPSAAEITAKLHNNLMTDLQMIHKCTNSKTKQVQLRLLAETALQEVSKHNSYTLSHSNEAGKKESLSGKRLPSSHGTLCQHTIHLGL